MPALLPAISRLVEDLSADLLPPREWALRQWFCATPRWYYHRPGPAPDLAPASYRLVDPELRPLCRLLHQAGCRTTPSCQGHSYTRGHFAQTWRQLQVEAAAIAAGGLAVRDSATGATALFRRPGYRLPWPTFDAFFAAIDAQQRQGYLGILVPATRAPFIERLRREGYATARTRIVPDPELSARFQRPFFSVRVDTPDRAARTREWQAAARYFCSLLNAGAGAPAGPP